MLIFQGCVPVFFFKGFKDDFWWGWFLEENILGNFFNMKKDPERDHKQWTFLCICQKYDWFHCFEATYSKDTCQFILKRTSEQKGNQRHLNKHTLPKTNSLPLKIGHPKRKFKTGWRLWPPTRAISPARGSRLSKPIHRTHIAQPCLWRPRNHENYTLGFLFF